MCIRDSANATDVVTALNELLAGVNEIVNAQIKANAAIAESKLAMDDAAGHTHTGAGGNGTKVTITEDQVPAAVDGGAHGAQFYEKGTESSLAAAGTAAISFGASFTDIPIVLVEWDNSGTWEIFTSGIKDITSSGFDLYNGLGAQADFRWRAIGI
jgi:hypothetical protein